MFESDFLFHVLKFSSCSFHCKKKEQNLIRPKFRKVRLKKTKGEMENKMNTSFEDELLLLVLLRRRWKIRSLRRSLKRASSRYWVQNLFKKREEFGKYHRLVPRASK